MGLLNSLFANISLYCNLRQLFGFNAGSFLLVNRDVFIKNILISLIVIIGISLSPIAFSAKVIANSSATSLTKSQLRRIFSMRQLLWSDGQKIIVFVLPSSHQLHQNFSKNKLGMFSYKLDRIWNKLTYSGLGTAPIVVQSPQELITAVLNTSGAIGYIEDSANVKDAYVIQIED